MPPWREYDHHTDSYSRSQMIPFQQIPEYGSSSRSESKLTADLPGIYPVIWTWCSISTLPGLLSGTHGNPLSSMWTRSLMALELWKPIVIAIAGWPPFLRIAARNTILRLREKIFQTRVVIKPKLQSVWSKLGSPRSNLPNTWGSPTTLLQTSGRKYWWLGFRWKSLLTLYTQRIDWNSFETGPCNRGSTF